MRTWYALNSAVFGLSHVDVSNVGAQVGLGGEYPDTHVTPLVAGVVCQARHLAGELLLLQEREITLSASPTMKLMRLISINKFLKGTS